jgi:hypothetical protein
MSEQAASGAAEPAREEIQKPPAQDREAMRRDPRNSKKLWTVEINFNDPRPEMGSVVRRHQFTNLLYVEMRELRFSMFSEGILYPLSPGQFLLVPPFDLRHTYVFKQQKFVE